MKDLFLIEGNEETRRFTIGWWPFGCPFYIPKCASPSLTRSGPFSGDTVAYRFCAAQPLGTDPNIVTIDAENPSQRQAGVALQTGRETWGPHLFSWRGTASSATNTTSHHPGAPKIRRHQELPGGWAPGEDFDKSRRGVSSGAHRPG